MLGAWAAQDMPILEFGFFSQTLYCINIFVNNRDQGFATFLTLNTTCMTN
jgi:hypothetical protein